MRRPELERTLLRNRARVGLFWLTIATILAVAAIAVTTILRMWGGPRGTVAPPAIVPAEISLCPGERQGFTLAVDIPGGVSWAATGGTISPDGIYAAGSLPGDYSVSAGREGASDTGTAIVHIVECTPVPTRTPLPTSEPVPTPTATPVTVSLLEDPQADILTYEGDAPESPIPAGMDIRMASVSPDTMISLEPVAGTPPELLDWVSEGEVLLWMTLHAPIPDPPDVYIYWLFALDVDGDTTTGRTPGAARINPDLGDEAAVGVYFDPASGTFVPDISVWNPEQGTWVTIENGVRYYISEARTLVAFAVAYETLERGVTEISGVTLKPEAVRGRAAVLSYAGDDPVIDFYPDRPE